MALQGLNKCAFIHGGEKGDNIQIFDGYLVQKIVLSIVLECYGSMCILKSKF